jgi:hypothetical protein
VMVFLRVKFLVCTIKTCPNYSKLDRLKCKCDCLECYNKGFHDKSGDCSVNIN